MLCQKHTWLENAETFCFFYGFLAHFCTLMNKCLPLSTPIFCFFVQFVLSTNVIKIWNLLNFINKCLLVFFVEKKNKAFQSILSAKSHNRKTSFQDLNPLSKNSYLYFPLIFLKSYLRYKTIFWCVTNEFFYLKKIQYFVVVISRFLYFCKMHRFENLWCHHKHCYILEAALMLISFESQTLSKSNLIKWLSDVWQTFLTCFWVTAGDWKLVPGSFMILSKWQYSKIWSLLIADI